MARIVEKDKNEKAVKSLGSKVWTWVVGIVLTAVFIGSVILLVLFLIKKDDEETPVEDTPTTFEEKYSNAQLITFKDVEEKILSDNPKENGALIGSNYETIYVFVYSPDYVTYPNGEVVSGAVNAMIEATGDNSGAGTKFFVVNTETEDNKAFDLSSSTYLTEAASYKSPYLIKIVISDEDGQSLVIEEIFTTVGDIINELGK